MDCPRWCVDGIDDKNKGSIFWDCENIDLGEGVVVYNSIPSLNPKLAYSIDLINLSFLLFINVTKRKFRNLKGQHLWANYACTTIIIISIVDYIVALFLISPPKFADLFKSVIMVFFLTTVRTSLINFGSDLFDSFHIIVTIFSFIFLYAILGYVLFEKSMEG
jgi:hypothetical protein